jgi:hypothetical protein
MRSRKQKCNVHSSAKDVNTGEPGTHAWWWENCSTHVCVVDQ